MTDKNPPVAGVLLCAPADAPFAVPGSRFDRVCARCGTQVMIAPTGQRLLAQHALRVICYMCFEPNGRDAGAKHALAAPVEELVSEVKASRKNPRRGGVN